LGAAASPVWLPWLADVSQICATVAPIVGVAWLLFQFGLKSGTRSGRNDYKRHCDAKVDGEGAPPAAMIFVTKR
jgi:hypothetical protein